MPERFQLHPKVALAFTLWCATILLAAATFWSMRAAYLARVAEREQRAVGTVYAPGHWNHGPVYKYKFAIAGRTGFAGASRTPEDARLAQGQSVTVYYDPLHPRTNSLISFAQSPPNYPLIGTYLCGSVGVAGYGVILWRRARKRGQA